MKVRNLSICDTCRGRKRKCDGKRPACTPCLRGGWRCSGYAHPILIVQHPLSAASKEGPKRVPCGDTRLELSPGTIPNADLVSEFATFKWSTTEEFYPLILQHFIPAEELPRLPPDPATAGMLVCSSWLHVLPTIMERKATVPLISSSISTLGLSILSKSSGQRKWELRYMQSYCATTQALRQLLQAGARQPGHELAAAALCLSLIEALKPKFDHGWFGHVRAGAELIQLAGPRAFAEPVPLKLLIGFCPILLSEACLSQRKSFLDSDDWRRVLFSQSSPSPMLSLMSTAAIIPGLLQETAALPFQSPQHTLSVAHQLLSAFSSVLFALDQWELSLRGSTSGPLFWPGETRGSLHAGGGPPTSAIHFSDTYKAMCLMQAWAYGIECLTGIERLGSTIDGILRTSVMSEMQSAWNRETVLGLSRKIYQSLWYFLQDNLRLYGPVSTVFPLNIAYEALLSHCPEASDDDIKGCEHAISLLSQKGFALHPRAKQS